MLTADGTVKPRPDVAVVPTRSTSWALTGLFRASRSVTVASMLASVSAVATRSLIVSLEFVASTASLDQKTGGTDGYPLIGSESVAIEKLVDGYGVAEPDS